MGRNLIQGDRASNFWHVTCGTGCLHVRMHVLKDPIKLIGDWWYGAALMGGVVRQIIYFLFNRKLLTQLSRCGWKVLSAYLKQSVPFDEAIPGAAIAVHTFGDFQQFNPHLHMIATDGCFTGGGTFAKGCAAEAKDLEELFRYEVLKMLKAEGKINDAVIENMLG